MFGRKNDKTIVIRGQATGIQIINRFATKVMIKDTDGVVHSSIMYGRMPDDMQQGLLGQCVTYRKNMTGNWFGGEMEQEIEIPGNDYGWSIILPRDVVSKYDQHLARIGIYDSF